MNLHKSLEKLVQNSQIEEKFRAKIYAVEQCMKNLSDKEKTKSMSLEEAKEFVNKSKNSCLGVDFDDKKENFDNMLKEVERRIDLVNNRDMMPIKEFIGHYDY